MTNELMPIEDNEEVIEKPKNTPTPPSNHSRRWLLSCGIALLMFVSFCCVLPILGFGTMVAVAQIASSNEVTDQNTEVLEVTTEQINLSVKNEIGEVIIRGGDVEDIEVEITRQSSGISEDAARSSLDDLEIELERDDDEYKIEVDQNDGGFLGFARNASVDLRITVPTRLNLDVQSDVGSIDIRDVIILDELDLSNEVGSIRFDGQIGPTGDHEISSEVGSIELRIAEGSAFELEVETEVGSIDNQLELSNVERERENGPGETLQGVYGRESNASLRISSEVGSIEIRN